MKKLRITSGPLEIVDNTRNQLAIKSESGRSIVFIPGLHPDAEGNSELILDAFKVANEIGYTPTMLIEERQRLSDHIKAIDQAVTEASKSDRTIVEIMEERKEASKLLAKSKKLLEKANKDPLEKDQNKKTAFFTHIQRIGEFIEKTK